MAQSDGGASEGGGLWRAVTSPFRRREGENAPSQDGGDSDSSEASFQPPNDNDARAPQAPVMMMMAQEFLRHSVKLISYLLSPGYVPCKCQRLI